MSAEGARENTNVDAGEAVDGEDFFHGGAVRIVETARKGVDGVGFEGEGRVGGADAQDGQAELPKGVVGRCHGGGLAARFSAVF